MQVQLDKSQVRSQRKISSSSSGLVNSTHWRGKSRATSGTRTLYARTTSFCAWNTTLVETYDVAVVRVPEAKIALSTASVYPESTAAAFEIAARLGYDGVEVMVWTDPVSQDADALKRLSEYHGIAILAIHAPCLIITQRVWGTEPWAKLVRARNAADTVGAKTVVVHPPFRWQREYARDFLAGIQRMADETDVRFAVENMFPLRARGRAVTPYSPDWDPSEEDFRHFTLDLSHTAVSQSDA